MARFLNKYLKEALHDNKGFSLIEMLVTMAIIAFGLIALIKLQGTVQQNNSLAKSQTLAINLAQSKMEQLRTMGQTATGGADSIGPLNTASSIEFPGLVNIYNRTWTTALLPGSSDSSSKKDIIVTVTWPDKNGNVSLDSTITLMSSMENIPAGLEGSLF